MVRASAGDDRRDALQAKALPRSLVVVTTIGIDHIGLLPRHARLATGLREARDDRKNQGVVPFKGGKSPGYAPASSPSIWSTMNASVVVEQLFFGSVAVKYFSAL